ncbi:MAG: hypothetical protein HYU75_09220, partial [Betaproteobacteria bacterium]|nr:hypothetical protein [Betaproteobacteria bacterium]
LRRAAETARDALDPGSDPFASGSYRKHLAGVLARRALVQTLLERALLRAAS